MQDLIVVGGSYAGMAAALQLVRARRKVLVIDAGQRRNRLTGQSHGFLGQDGADPAAIWDTARTQLISYPTLSWVGDLADEVWGARDDFHLATRAGDSFAARRILFATGVVDHLPRIAGLEFRWGRTVFHCPYCHGYEMDQGPIGVIATGPMSLHQAQLLTDWGKVTLLTNGALVLEPEQLHDLARRGIAIEEAPVQEITGPADVVLKDGRRLQFAGLFIATRTTPASPLAESLGCALIETPMGLQIQTDDSKETSIPGAFACGDVARAPHSVSLAVADGAWAGAQIHRSLVWPPT